MIFKEIEYQCLDWIKLAQGRGPVTRLCKYGTDPSGSINVREFTLCFWRVTQPLGVSYKFPVGPPSRLYVRRGHGFRPRVGSKMYVTLNKGMRAVSNLRLAEPEARTAPLSSKCWSPCKWEKGDMTHSWRAESLAESLIGLRLTVLCTADSNEPFNRLRRPFVDAWRRTRDVYVLYVSGENRGIFWNETLVSESFACVCVQQVIYVFMLVAHSI
jgi:hypothetical protein